LIETNRNRIVLICLLLVVVGLGLASRRFGASLPDFVSANAGDALWTVAVFVTLAILFPCWPTIRIGLLAFAISVIVEISQLSDASFGLVVSQDFQPIRELPAKLGAKTKFTYRISSSNPSLRLRANACLVTVYGRLFNSVQKNAILGICF